MKLFFFSNLDLNWKIWFCRMCCILSLYSYISFYFGQLSFIKNCSFSINFCENGCVIRGKGDCINGLYLLGLSSLSLAKVVTAPTFSCKASYETWHQSSLGHISHSHLHTLNNSLNFTILLDCHTCPLAKQKRLSFFNNNHIADNIFDIVHCVIWEPFSHTTSWFLVFSYFGW